MIAEVTTPAGECFTYGFHGTRWTLRGADRCDVIFNKLGLDKTEYCRSHYPKTWEPYGWSSWPMTRSKAGLLSAMVGLRAYGCTVRFSDTQGVDIPKKLAHAILGASINKFFDI